MSNAMEIGRALGAMEANSKAALYRFDRLDHAQSRVHDEIRGARRDVQVLGRRMELIERRRKRSHPLEKWVKRVLVWGLPITTLAATGSWRAALDVLKITIGAH